MAKKLGDKYYKKKGVVQVSSGTASYTALRAFPQSSRIEGAAVGTDSFDRRTFHSRLAHTFLFACDLVCRDRLLQGMQCCGQSCRSGDGMIPKSSRASATPEWNGNETAVAPG